MRLDGSLPKEILSGVLGNVYPLALAFLEPQNHGVSTRNYIPCCRYMQLRSCQVNHTTRRMSSFKEKLACAPLCFLEGGNKSSLPPPAAGSAPMTWSCIVHSRVSQLRNHHFTLLGLPSSPLVQAGSSVETALCLTSCIRMYW